MQRLYGCGKKNIKKYYIMKGTSGYGLVYKSDRECQLVGYCDSDYARDLDDKKEYIKTSFLLRIKTYRVELLQTKGDRPIIV